MPGPRDLAVPAGLILIALGLERLLSAYLIGSQAASWSTRLLIGVFCVVGGVGFLGAAGRERHHDR